MTQIKDTPRWEDKIHLRLGRPLPLKKVPVFRRNYAIERAAPDTFRVRFWRAFDRWVFPLVLAAVFVAVLIVAWVCYDVAFATPTVSGIQHAAFLAPLIAFRRFPKMAALVAFLRTLNNAAK